MPYIADSRPAPPTVIGPATKKATRPSDPLPQSLIDGARVAKKEVFDAGKHLNFSPPKGVTTMKEIGLDGRGISPIAASEPFPLSPPKQSGKSEAKYSVAGVDLVQAFDYEIANINISVKKDCVAGSDYKQEPDVSAFAWHYDSFPFVCVTMLSDCSNMVGGETAIRTPAGDIKKIRGPEMGTAVVIQGRYIEHQALKAIGGLERISMVTPFRPRDPSIRDELVLTGSRAISNWSELYHGFTGYRLELLEDRLRLKMKEEQKRVDTKRPFSIPNMTAFLREQIFFLEATVAELTPVEEMD
ncbi:hypothetical protein N7509_000806 [Penicillium cosmopolitanum]|uniref:Fe2OG dioxygenase domain-containing protein n=1 Tax=Penicillium cosmopolitanum TaxID=1131564 RepID=A0A9W9WBM8_9EURO|nr:uncharacterized protein N7509_000806 [Penicillium cosmopolitanum]KAJ5414179.1 hypothetical protein N7509_000806 [Penicillium cosmopolitanum]